MIEQDVNLSSLNPDAAAYLANDIAIDNEGNAYVSDWYAKVVYKVVALTPGILKFVIHQDFSSTMAKTWKIEQIKF